MDLTVSGLPFVQRSTVVGLQRLLHEEDFRQFSMDASERIVERDPQYFSCIEQAAHAFPEEHQERVKCDMILVHELLIRSGKLPILGAGLDVSPVWHSNSVLGVALGNLAMYVGPMERENEHLFSCATLLCTAYPEMFQAQILAQHTFLYGGLVTAAEKGIVGRTYEFTSFLHDE